MLLRGILPLLLLLSLVPPAWAQDTKGIGVVMALTGQADVKRPAVPQAMALKLKDPLNVRDIVETREQALARLLLMGKSTVTVRELSRFEIREERLPDGAQRAGIDLAAGRVRVQVARRLMKPGDEIQIRTINVIVAVRGSEGIIEADKLPDGTPRTRVTGVSGEFRVTLPTTKPITTMADIVSDAGSGIRLVQLPGGGTIFGFDQWEILGLPGFQQILRSVLTLQDLLLLLREFELRHIRNGPEGPDAAQARADANDAAPGLGGPPGTGGGGPPKDLILPFTGANLSFGGPPKPSD